MVKWLVPKDTESALRMGAAAFLRRGNARNPETIRAKSYSGQPGREPDTSI